MIAVPIIVSINIIVTTAITLSIIGFVITDIDSFVIESNRSLTTYCDDDHHHE